MVIITHLCFLSFWFRAATMKQCKFLLQIRGPETDIFSLDESQNSYLTCIIGTLQNFCHRTLVHQTIMRAENNVLQKLYLGNKKNCALV